MMQINPPAVLAVISEQAMKIAELEAENEKLRREARVDTFTSGENS